MNLLIPPSLRSEYLTQKHTGKAMNESGNEERTSARSMNVIQRRTHFFVGPRECTHAGISSSHPNVPTSTTTDDAEKKKAINIR